MNPTQPTHNTAARRLLTIFCLLFGLLWSLQAHAGKRVALIIGNNDYRGSGFLPLKNPINDARLLSQRLAEPGLDFQMVMVDGANYAKDQNIDALDTLLERFVVMAKSADVALIYFSGHGLSDNHNNGYLVPSGEYDSNGLKPRYLLKVSNVIAQLKRTGAKSQLLILDACRNIPTGFNASKSGGHKGLAQMTDNSSGIFIAYATDQNSLAYDGKGKNSPFAESLVAALAPKDLAGKTWVNVMYSVKHRVMKATESHQPQQRPRWDNDLANQLVLIPAKPVVVVPTTPTPTTKPPLKPTQPTVLKPTSSDKVSAATIKQLRQHLDDLGCYQQLKKQDGKWGWRDKYALKQLLQKNSYLQGVVGNEPGEQWLDVMKELDIQSCKNVAAQATPSKPTPSKPTAVKPSVPKPPVAQTPVAQPSKPTADISPQPPKVNQVNPAEIKRKLQVQLNRLNCNAGGADGKWGSKSKAALNRLRNANSGLKAYGTSPTEKLLQAIQNRNWQRCPEVVISKPSPSKLVTPKLVVVTAEIELNTGFLVTDKFKKDYQTYTGRKSFPKTRIVHYRNLKERSRFVKKYENNYTSKVAGELFFSHLSKAYRKEYKKMYENYKRYQEGVEVTCAQLGSNNQKSCNLLKNNKKAVDSFKAFYLLKMSFVD